MRTETIKICTFEELSKEAQEKAIEKLHDTNVKHDWWDSVYENQKEEIKKYFEVENIYFSGFYSQGDGAMFEYSSINTDFFNSIVDEMDLPKWKKNILKNFTSINAKGKHNGHYYHERCCNHSIYIESDNGAQYYQNIENFIEEQSISIEIVIIKKYMDLCKEIYKSLEEEYDYLTSKDTIIETIKANDYEFYEDGSIY